MKLTKEMHDKIDEAAQKISYGSITIILVDHLNEITIEVSERLRFEKGSHRPGELVNPSPPRSVRVTRNDLIGRQGA